MPKYFGQHRGHLKATAQKIATKHGARHINFPRSGWDEPYGWFEVENFDGTQTIIESVLSDLAAAGGIEVLGKSNVGRLAEWTPNWFAREMADRAEKLKWGRVNNRAA